MQHPDVRPLRWWSAIQLRAIVQRVRAVLQPWADDWRHRVEACDAWNAGGVPPHKDAPEAWQPLHVTDGEALWVGALAEIGAPGAARGRGAPGASEDPLVAACGGRALGGARADSMAAALQRQSADELRAALASLGPPGGPGSAPPVAAERRPPPGAWRRWSGAVHLRCRLHGEARSVLWIGLPPSVVTRLAPPASAAAPACSGGLVPVLTALRDEAVALEVGLADLSLDLASILSLRVGDVIATQHRLDAPLRVGLRGLGTSPALTASPWCAGHLGAQAGRKAVALELRALARATSPSA